MTTLDWLSHALASQRVHVPCDLSDWLATGVQELGGWFLLDERGAVANRDKLARLYPLREALPFARRGDRDDVACLVLRDPEHLRGSVVVIHDGAMAGHEVEEVASLAQWFGQAQREGSHAIGSSGQAAAAPGTPPST